MYISKSRFINWTRCPMYFPMDYKYNPTKKEDIDREREERRKEMLEEMTSAMASSGGADDFEDEEFDASPSPELEALLPYYNQVEDEALKVAKKYFHGTFVADYKDVHKQKLFEYEHNNHIYRCYVDIYNENEKEISIIEVKATTSSKYINMCFSENRGGPRYPMFVKSGNIWHLNTADSTASDNATRNFNSKKAWLLDRYRAEGKYPHDIAFQRFVIEHALRKAGDNRPVNYYLAVLNSEYVYDGAVDAKGDRVYNEIDGQEIITFFDMNEISADYQPIIKKGIASLESYISSQHDITVKTPVGKWCAWGMNTECVFVRHCFYENLRNVPKEENRANNYLNFRGFAIGNIADKYQLINEGYYKFDDVPREWLNNDNHLIQRECYDNGTEYVDKEKMRYWFGELEYPIYHFDFEAFPCPLPRFCGETPYRQSVFEFSLHIERAPGVCDKTNDNYIFLNANCDDDEREALAQAIIDHFEFTEEGSLHGTMLAQNTTYEKKRLTELAELFPQYRQKLLAIRDKSADLIHLLKTKRELYIDAFGEERAKTINYYNKELSGSYSIKKTLPVLVKSLTYKDMSVSDGVKAYITYLKYDSAEPTFGVLRNKEERREALKKYCQQDTWAMVEILREIRKKI